MTVPLNAATPTGFLGQSLSFAINVSVPAGATFDESKLGVTTNAPGAVVVLDAAPTGVNSAYNVWIQTGTLSSPNTPGTYLLSASVNGTDEQDVAVTWNPQPVETVLFDPSQFAFH